MTDERNRRQALVGLATLTLLAGCSARSAGEAETPEAESDAQTGLDLSALEGKTLRVVPKGGMMTMDYRQDRLTILLDEDERIERAYVG